jgi:hypothetical protein
MTVSAIERGSNYTRDSLDAIARAFGLDNATSLDARLHDWAAKLAASLPVNEAIREWLEIYDALAQDPESLAELVRFLRRLARDRTRTPGPSEPTRARTPGPGRKRRK